MSIWPLIWLNSNYTYLYVKNLDQLYEEKIFICTILTRIVNKHSYFNVDIFSKNQF